MDYSNGEKFLLERQTLLYTILFLWRIAFSFFARILMCFSFLFRINYEISVKMLKTGNNQ